MKYLGWFLVVMSLLSCDSQTVIQEIEINEPEDKLVGEVHVDSTIHVAVSKLFFPKKGETSEIAFVNKGKVLLNSITTGETFELYTKDNFVYENEDVIMLANHKYQVIIDIPERETLIATFDLFPAVKLDTCIFESIGEQVNIKVGFKDASDIQNHYFLQLINIFPNQSSEEFVECQTYGYISDKCFDGTNTFLNMYVPKNKFSEVDTIEIRFGSVNESQYKRDIKTPDFIFSAVVPSIFESDFEQGLGKIYIDQSKVFRYPVK